MKDESTRFAPKTKLWLMLAASLACAITSRVAIYISNGDLGLMLGCGLSSIWAVLLLRAIWLYRWRGLWLLVGTPLACWLPYMMYLLSQACAHNRLACP